MAVGECLIWFAAVDERIFAVIVMIDFEAVRMRDDYLMVLVCVVELLLGLMLMMTPSYHVYYHLQRSTPSIVE